MNADEIIWRIEECEQLLRECEAKHEDGACELIKARMAAMKNELVLEIERVKPVQA